MKTPNANSARLIALAATTLVVAACSSGGGDGYDAPAGNTAPSIVGLANQSADQDTTIGPIAFSISDGESAASDLTVQVAIEGSGIFAGEGVVLGGSGGARTLTLVPNESAVGETLVTLNVSDPQGALTTRNFLVQVNARRASLLNAALDTFARNEDAEHTVVNGYTFDDDAVDATAFAELIGPEEP